MRYTVILERDPSATLVAHVPALRGCVSQGRSKREALKNIREAIGLYIETLIEHGQPVPIEAGREVVELSVVGR
jgi:predicted RNase H-like HicB family nuclease